VSACQATWQRLRELVYRDGLYFTFTQFDKVGINPMSQYAIHGLERMYG
jgi:hypothetical protein